MKNLNYYKESAEEDYTNTPISVLKYISELEKGNRQGIQWNKYPDTKPTEDGNYLVVDTEGTVVVWTWICKVKDHWGDITHWAEINLPNQ